MLPDRQPKTYVIELQFSKRGDKLSFPVRIKTKVKDIVAGDRVRWTSPHGKTQCTFTDQTIMDGKYFTMPSRPVKYRPNIIPKAGLIVGLGGTEPQGKGTLPDTGP